MFNITKGQKGLALIEALISMLILSITAAGSLYIIGRANVSKTQMSLQYLAVQQLRQELITKPRATLCGDPVAYDGKVKLPTGAAGGRELDITVVSGCGEKNVQVGPNALLGSVNMAQRITLKITDTSLFSGDGEIVVGGSADAS